MSSENGVIRVGRKGRKKFAFGEDGAPFEVDVVVAFQEWICVDEGFRERGTDRVIPVVDMKEYHQAAVDFVKGLVDAQELDITTAEALEFIARLREAYDEMISFFQPRTREKPELPDTSAAEMRFSVEES